MKAIDDKRDRLCDESPVHLKMKDAELLENGPFNRIRVQELYRATLENQWPADCFDVPADEADPRQQGLKHMERARRVYGIHLAGSLAKP